jgi:N-sulfoglucosamine sulfohydrolase
MKKHQISRRTFLKTSSIGTTALALPFFFTNCSKKERPNILWLISEDTSPDIGCYGNQIVKTPNLDKLVSEGILFSNAFATCPVCSPARSAMMTGMYQTSIGAHQHRTRDKKPLPEPVKIFTEYFRQAGYFISNCRGEDYNKPGKTDWNFKSEVNAFDGTDWSQRQTGQPFFAQMNFRLTHRTFERDPENPIDPDQVEIPPYYPEHPITRRDWADYLESLQVLDKQIGKVLQRLKDEGLEKNTIIVYCGDHGRPHVRGKQWLYESGIRVPLIVRLPDHLSRNAKSENLVSLIDIAPTLMNLVGIKPPQHLQGIDFLGRDKSEREFIFAARDRCDGTSDRIRCVRTKRYKYIRNFFPDLPYTQYNAYKKRQYPVLTLLKILHKKGELTSAQTRFMAPVRPAEELYDLDNDPFEINNLVKNPSVSHILKDLRFELNKWIQETDDKGVIPESQETINRETKLMYESYQRKMKNKGLSPDISDEDFLKWWEKKLFAN